MARITLYHSPYSRSVTAYWMLEELGVPFDVVHKDIAQGRQKDADLLALNPAGKVPTVVIDGVVLTERPAICTYLSDRFSPGELAPALDAIERGPYLNWMTYSVSVMEASMIMHEQKIDVDPVHAGWGRHGLMLDTIEARLQSSPFIAGERFTAADVMFGSTLGWGLFANMIEKRAAFTRYFDVVSSRDGFTAAAAATYV